MLAVLEATSEKLAVWLFVDRVFPISLISRLDYLLPKYYKAIRYSKREIGAIYAPTYQHRAQNLSTLADCDSNPVAWLGCLGVFFGGEPSSQVRFDVFIKTSRKQAVISCESDVLELASNALRIMLSMFTFIIRK